MTRLRRPRWDRETVVIVIGVAVAVLVLVWLALGGMRNS
jgi:hypothetical protein